MESLKVSIVTVCYNAVETIEETMLSVLNQTYDNIEYIIIDGGSTDGTVDVIKKYADRLAYWVSETDKGIYDAMNKGIAVATGDYIYFLGADDTLLSDTVISKVVNKMSVGYSTVFYGDVMLHPSGEKYSGKFSKFDLIRKNICHQAIFYPKSLLTEYPYDLKYKTYSDYHENIKLWGLGVLFKYIPVTVGTFVVGGASSTGDGEFMRDRAKIVKSNLGIIGYVYYLLRVKIVDLLRKVRG